MGISTAPHRRRPVRRPARPTAAALPHPAPPLDNRWVLPTLYLLFVLGMLFVSALVYVVIVGPTG